MRADLLAVRRRLTVSGYTIQLPVASRDGRHADYAPAVAGALDRARVAPTSPPKYDPEQRYEQAESIEQRARRMDGDAMEATVRRPLEAQSFEDDWISKIERGEL